MDSNKPMHSTEFLRPSFIAVQRASKNKFVFFWPLAPKDQNIEDDGGSVMRKSLLKSRFLYKSYSGMRPIDLRSHSLPSYHAP